jgi:hypothetical protein
VNSKLAQLNQLLKDLVVHIGPNTISPNGKACLNKAIQLSQELMFEGSESPTVISKIVDPNPTSEVLKSDTSTFTSTRAKMSWET